MQNAVTLDSQVAEAYGISQNLSLLPGGFDNKSWIQVASATNYQILPKASAISVLF